MAPVTLYVGNLDSSITEEVLYEHFEKHAPECDLNFFAIVKDSQTNQSLGYAVVDFCNHDQGCAALAIKLVDSTLLMNKPIQVILSPFHHDSSPSVVFIKNLPKSITRQALFNVLKRYGTILSINLASDASGYAAVRYDCVEPARAAITDLNGKLFWNNNPLHVSSFLMVALYGFPERAYNKLSLRLPEDVSPKYLRDTLSPFGPITSVTVSDLPPKGKRFGAVTFVDSKAADRAAKAAKLHPRLVYLGRIHENSPTFRPLGEMDAKMIVSKQLHLNLFESQAEDEQQKTERSQAQFSQMCPVTALPVYPLPLPIHSPPAMYPLPGPGFAHKMLYPQALPTLFPLQNLDFGIISNLFLVYGSMRPPVGAQMPKPIFQMPRENLYPLVDQASIVMQLSS
ncbi:Protein phosphatase PP2A regulatory subunit B [Orobanche minor]